MVPTGGFLYVRSTFRSDRHLQPPIFLKAPQVQTVDTDQVMAPGRALDTRPSCKPIFPMGHDESLFMHFYQSESNTVRDATSSKQYICNF
jgi:hypothetical protein